MKIKITLTRPLFCSFFEKEITSHSQLKYNLLINNKLILITYTLLM